MKYDRFSRRMFLQGAGTVLSIPLLESLLPRSARAAIPEPTKRYLYYYVDFDHGHNRNWLPQLTALSNSLPVPGNPNPGTYDRLQTIMARAGRSSLSPIFGSEFNPFVDKMMFYKGLDVISHGFHCLNTAALGGMEQISADLNFPTQTLDYYLSRNPKFDPSTRPVINVGPGGFSFESDGLGGVVKRGAAGRSPYDVYKKIFNNGNYPESEDAVQANPRRDILTRVLGDYQRIINGKKVGKTDKIVLTNAMDAVSDLQNGLQREVAASCRHKGMVDPLSAYPASVLDAFSYGNYVKLITAIFTCDMSRVVLFCTGHSNSEDWSGLPNKDFHGNVTHMPQVVVNGIPNWKHEGMQLNEHMKVSLVPLLKALDSCIDPANGKSYLDNGLVHVTTESVQPHRQANMPTVTVGSWDGLLPTGYMVNYSDPSRPFTFSGGTINGGGGWDDDPKTATDPMTDMHSYDYPGIPYQRFLVTLMQAVGMTPSEYENPQLNLHLQNRSDGLYGSQNDGITHVGGFGISSIEKGDTLDPNGAGYHHARRMRRYNWHYYKDPIPLPPKV